MLASLLLSLSAHAVVPADRDLPVGPPSPHLDTHLPTQWRLSARDEVRGLRDRWGGALRFDERTGLPRFWYGSGVPLAEVEALVGDLATLARVAPGDLVYMGEVRRDTLQGERRLLRWQRTWKGVPVEGDEVLVVAIDGRIAGAWTRLQPVRLPSDLEPLPDERVFLVPRDAGRPPQAALVTVQEVDDQRIYTDRDGEVVYRYDLRRHGTAQVSYLERTVGDDMLEAPARQISLTDASGLVEETDDDGAHSLSGSVTALLEGAQLGVYNNGADIVVSGLDEDFTLTGDEEIPQSAATVLHHFHVVWDWLESRWPEHAWLDDFVPATVEVNGYCNAYYTGGTINFYREYRGTCANLGEIADVVYHEVGHGIHQYILAGGTFAGDISEGSADYISSTILDDPILAPEAWGTGTYIREIETDKVYPDDVTGGVHSDGLIWASFLWNLREQWIDGLGYDAGVEQTDLLFLGALEQGPSLTDAYEAVLIGDDDDGDLTNGTPHACELVELLDLHGLGPGPLGVVVLDHEPLGPQGSSDGPYAVDVDIYDLTVDCSGLDPDSPTLWYTNDDDLGLSDAWASTPLAAVHGSDSLWQAEIPRQPAGAHVRYYVTVASSDGTTTLASHGGDVDQVYDFWVGDRQSLWCEDFEVTTTHGKGKKGHTKTVETVAEGWSHGPGVFPGDRAGGSSTDEWAYGLPLGGSEFDPTEPWAGDGIAATDLDGDYEPSNRQHLISPAVDVSGHGPMLLLSYQRWLTVEDAYYDQATLYANDVQLWQNYASSSGGVHHLDMQWTGHDLPVADLVDDDGSLTFRWTLKTDGGLEYGGWNLDDVCVVQLDDVPGHYTRVGLQATDEAEGAVTISWTNPWITPLSTTMLVASQEGFPESPDDGRIVYVDLTPEYGEAVSVEDSVVDEGETWFYVLFAAGEGEEEWMGGVVEGDNADTGSRALPVEPGDTGDTGSVEDGGSADGGSADGGSADGGSADGGSADGGSADGGAEDGGAADGGSEALDGGSDEDDGGKGGCSTAGGAFDGTLGGLVGLLLPLLALRRRRRG